MVKKVFVRDNVLKGKVPNKPGMYIFYNSSGAPIYVGHASKLRHRLQSYYQNDCFATHPTKYALRKRIKYFSFKVMAKREAQHTERKIKNGGNNHNGMRFNYL